MDHYYVNKNAQSNGDHEVHKESCDYLPSSENRIYLGYFSNCSEAVQKARESFDQSNGCYFCSYECHTT
ncbi:hypothetical protein KJ762_12475 [bacterium]|nr:hypothetical protein [bacterium]MBU1064844.1 hypothetical protein [bacterium]MBU1635307.1 hypothetical protein [bacterium]MBU1873310.1 hypothetical protein [bacterium]